ncbi:MAG TPA: ABC transporter permease [Candidatus Limnocylindria bacterium]|jgi:ABC-2 type transport system permease protein|nr:ABC transporter permease [Candidatus Limnocylindria bacterium]
MNFISEVWLLAERQYRSLRRQPWWIAISLAQPIVYVLFYSQLFSRMTELPGFPAGSYLEFLTPGIIVMSALYSASFSGMGVLFDLERGVLDRFLVAPISRGAILGGRLCEGALTNMFQSLLLLGLGMLMGARYHGGVTGVLLMLVSAMLLALPIGALSGALALSTRKRETIFAATNFLLLPLVMLSPTFMAPTLMPSWMQTLAKFNPVGWAVTSARAGLAGQVHLHTVAWPLARLLLFAALALWASRQALKRYQRTA